MNRPSLSELRAAAADGPPYPRGFLAALRGDDRTGARQLYAACLDARRRAKALDRKTEDMLAFEREAIACGFGRIAGVDEAGRGPIAGPIVAAAVVLAEPIPGLNDSKLLTRERREALYAALTASSSAIGVAEVTAAEIDRQGIQCANYAAMARAAAQLEPPADFLLVDGFAIRGCAVPQRAIVKGDRLSLSIAAASIIAKVTRDRLMDSYDHQYPEYRFAQHKGYGTAVHLEALRRHGPSPIHRRSFAPVCEFPDTGLLFPVE